jgi:hypothetical protein
MYMVFLGHWNPYIQYDSFIKVRVPRKIQDFFRLTNYTWRIVPSMLQYRRTLVVRAPSSLVESPFKDATSRSSSCSHSGPVKLDP